VLEGAQEETNQEGYDTNTKKEKIQPPKMLLFTALFLASIFVQGYLGFELSQ
jgi:hypothetical protein